MSRFAAVLIFAGLLFVPRLSLPLLEPEEARYAEIARQMFAGGDFLVPTSDGQPYLDKPPLLYWLVIGCYATFGVSDAAARLVTVLSAWLMVAVVYWWGRRVAGEQAGLMGAVLLTLTGDFVYRAPMLTMNGPLGLCVTLTLAAGHVAITEGTLRPGWWVVSAVACAAGVLMKGPVALVLGAGPLLLFPAVDRKLARPTAAAWCGYAAIVLTLAGPWFAYVSAQVPGFVEYFLFKHHLERFAAPFDHAKPFWFYVPQIILGTFPWSLCFGYVAYRALRERSWGSFSPASRALLLAAASGIVLFSAAGSKRPVYLVPIYPPLALALGLVFVRRHMECGGWTPFWMWHPRHSHDAAPHPKRCPVTALQMVTAIAMLAGAWVGMPAYSERFSLRAVVRALEPIDAPLVCLGADWDSAGFYARRDDVRCFPTGDKSALLNELFSRERTNLIVSTKTCRAFLSELPETLVFEPRGENLIAIAGVVRRNETPAGD